MFPSNSIIDAIVNISCAEYVPTVLAPLYFVSDKNGYIYFSGTYEQHQETIATLKKKGLWFEYDSNNTTTNTSNVAN